MIPTNRWRPIPVDGLRDLMQGATFPWCLSGGLALERFVGEAYRPHGDTDISVFRSDQFALGRHLSDWNLYAVTGPGQLEAWKPETELPGTLHNIWAHRPDSDGWELEILLEEADADTWYYRRDRKVRLPRSAFSDDIDGLPAVRVEIQLLYKSANIRDRDQQDFERCVERFSDRERESLAALLRRAYPQGHEWLDRLDRSV